MDHPMSLFNEQNERLTRSGEVPNITRRRHNLTRFYGNLTRATPTGRREWETTSPALPR